MAIKKILISQETPMNKAPYDSLVEKFGVQIDFKPFFLIEIGRASCRERV